MLYDSATGVPVRVGERDGTTLAAIHVLPAAVAPDPSALPIPERVTKRLGDQIELLGFDITPQPLRPGQGATLTLWWRAVDHPSEPYRVQVQAKGKAAQPVFAGTYPMSRVPADGKPASCARILSLSWILVRLPVYRVDLSLARMGVCSALLRLGTVAVSAAAHVSPSTSERPGCVSWATPCGLRLRPDAAPGARRDLHLNSTGNQTATCGQLQGFRALD
jgi:hypothetical protein